MKCKRLNEVIELLQPAWQKEPDLNLLQFLQKLAKDAVIPGLQKDYEEDFKTALLRARGVIKE
ncbi:TPA: YihD family protein [Escherichia coli]|nr:YihD family protein [Escherichia coli]